MTSFLDQLRAADARRAKLRDDAGLSLSDLQRAALRAVRTAANCGYDPVAETARVAYVLHKQAAEARAVLVSCRDLGLVEFRRGSVSKQLDYDHSMPSDGSGWALTELGDAYASLRWDRTDC